MWKKIISFYFDWYSQSRIIEKNFAENSTTINIENPQTSKVNLEADDADEESEYLEDSQKALKQSKQYLLYLYSLCLASTWNSYF